MFLSLLALVFTGVALASDGADNLEVKFKVWSWKQGTVEDVARGKLAEAAKGSGYREVKEVDTSRVCSFLYCNVKATGRGVK